MRWFLFFALVFLAGDFVLLWLVASQVGVGETVFACAIAAVVGVKLAFRQGFRVLSAVTQALSEGKKPDESLLGVLMAVLGGLLLAWPGPVSAALGLMLLFLPAVRRVCGGLLARLWQDSVGATTAGPSFQYVSVSREPFDRTPPSDPRGSTGAVIDTEGVEVQQALLLPASADASQDKNN